MTGAPMDGGSRRKLRLAGTRVALAEDSWIIADAMRMLLEREGAVVSGPAATVEDARRITASGLCDVAVLDMNLRGQLATGLAVDLSQAGTPVVVLSGYSIEPQLKAIVSAALEKPVSEELLVAAIERAVKRG